MVFGLKNIPFVLFLGIFLVGGELGLRAQTLPENEPRPEKEERLRQHLRKLDQWGIMSLLRTEKEVDQRQKQRAAASTHPEELALLAEDEDSGVRFYVATNPHTPLDVLLGLAFDPIAPVRSGVAMVLKYDPLASQEVRETVENIALYLVQDTQALVRLGLANNTQLPDAVFEALVVDPDPIIRQKLAENIRLSQTALRALAQDPSERVQVQALKHRNTPWATLVEMSQDPSPDIRLAICENSNTPLHALEGLVGDADPRVRQAVAQHRNASLDMLEKMVKDKDIGVVVAIAQHHRADRHLLLALAADPRSLEIRESAKVRLKPLLRSEIREDILERWEEP